MITLNDGELLFKDMTFAVITNDSLKRSHEFFYNHYTQNIYTAYELALQRLGAVVKIINIEEFLEVTREGRSETKFDYVVNVCGGFKDLQFEGLIPAIAAFYSISCFPAPGAVSIIAEEKIISKHLATSAGFRVNESIFAGGNLTIGERYVVKPITSGDSKGLTLFRSESQTARISENQFIEKFIPGRDLTVYCVFNTLINNYLVINAFASHFEDPNGFEDVLHSFQKVSSDDFAPDAGSAVDWKHVDVSDGFETALNKIGKSLQTPFLFRLDARISKEVDISTTVKLDDCVFLEINVLPTIPGDDGWYSSKLAFFGNTEPLADNLSSSEYVNEALTILLKKWCFDYVQSKSAAGNKPLS